VPDSKGIFAPRWSPDDRYILAITAAGNDKLMLYDVKNQKWRQLNTSVNSFGYLAWSPDSAYIYFDTILNGDTGYFRLRISDSKMEKLVDLKKIRLYRDQFGPSDHAGEKAGFSSPQKETGSIELSGSVHKCGQNRNHSPRKS